MQFKMQRLLILKMFIPLSHLILTLFKTGRAVCVNPNLPCLLADVSPGFACYLLHHSLEEY